MSPQLELVPEGWKFALSIPLDFVLHDSELSVKLLRDGARGEELHCPGTVLAIDGIAILLCPFNELYDFTLRFERLAAEHYERVFPLFPKAHERPGTSAGGIHEPQSLEQAHGQLIAEADVDLEVRNAIGVFQQA